MAEASRRCEETAGIRGLTRHSKPLPGAVKVAEFIADQNCYQLLRIRIRQEFTFFTIFSITFFSHLARLGTFGGFTWPMQINIIGNHFAFMDSAMLMHIPAIFTAEEVSRPAALRQVNGPTKGDRRLPIGQG